jgi:hypothetical protein
MTAISQLLYLAQIDQVVSNLRVHQSYGYQGPDTLITHLAATSDTPHLHQQAQRSIEKGSMSKPQTVPCQVCVSTTFHLQVSVDIRGSGKASQTD